MTSNRTYIKISEKIFINIDAISYVEILTETLTKDKYGVIYLFRSQNGDRIFLNKDQTEKVLNIIGSFVV
jgi:hypothetical protein